jgi:hypothetical protein
MKNSKIKNIAIYSESNFISKILSQLCKDFLLETFPYSCFTSTTINTKPSIAIIDIKNQMVFDKIIEPYLSFYEFYPVLLLATSELMIPKNSFTTNSSIDILRKPLKYKALIEKIYNRSSNCIDQVSSNIFLNSKTLNLIRILNKEKIETKLTELEFKLLKYILDVQAATEQEILNNVFKYNSLSSTNTFKVHLHRLKQKLGFSIIERKDNREYIIQAPKSYNKV